MIVTKLNLLEIVKFSGYAATPDITFPTQRGYRLVMVGRSRNYLSSITLTNYPSLLRWYSYCD